MKIEFYKYQGTGNDFVILDNREEEYSKLTKKQVAFLCDRRFGIGADGLMLLSKHVDHDFEMIYYNADGRQASMCGNGGRCLVKFAFDMGIIQTAYKFIAVDGLHEASVETNGTVSLKMNDVETIKEISGHYILDTGSPHYVKIMDDIMHLDVFKKGREIRYSHEFQAEGINVNFVEQRGNDKLIVRTYERGVEDETFSCGTGVTAAALVCSHNHSGFNRVEVQTKGGHLSVEYDKIGDRYKNIWLSGPAEKVFDGIIQLKEV